MQINKKTNNTNKKILSDFFFVNMIDDYDLEKIDSLSDFLNKNKKSKFVIIHKYKNLILSFLDYLNWKTEIERFFETSFVNLEKIWTENIEFEISKFKKDEKSDKFFIFQKEFVQIIYGNDFAIKLKSLLWENFFIF